MRRLIVSVWMLATAVAPAAQAPLPSDAVTKLPVPSFDYRVTDGGLVLKPDAATTPEVLAECGFYAGVERIAKSGTNTFDAETDLALNFAAEYRLEQSMERNRDVDDRRREEAIAAVKAQTQRLRQELSRAGSDPAFATSRRARLDTIRPTCATIQGKVTAHYQGVNAGYVWSRLPRNSKPLETEPLYGLLESATRENLRLSREGAVALAEVLVRRESSARMYFLRAKCHTWDDDQRASQPGVQADYEKAVALAPANAEYAFAAASFVVEAPSPDVVAARRYLDQALRASPDLLLALDLSARLHMRDGNINAASAEVAALKRLRPAILSEELFSKYRRFGTLAAAVTYARGDFRDAYEAAVDAMDFQTYAMDPIIAFAARTHLSGFTDGEDLKDRLRNWCRRNSLDPNKVGPDCEVLLGQLDPQEYERRYDNEGHTHFVLGQLALVRKDKVAAERQFRLAVARRASQLAFDHAAWLAAVELKWLGASPAAGN